MKITCTKIENSATATILENLIIKSNNFNNLIIIDNINLSVTIEQRMQEYGISIINYSNRYDEITNLNENVHICNSQSKEVLLNTNYFTRIVFVCSNMSNLKRQLRFINNTILNREKYLIKEIDIIIFNYDNMLQEVLKSHLSNYSNSIDLLESNVEKYIPNLNTLQTRKKSAQFINSYKIDDLFSVFTKDKLYSEVLNSPLPLSSKEHLYIIVSLLSSYIVYTYGNNFNITDCSKNDINIINNILHPGNLERCGNYLKRNEMRKNYSYLLDAVSGIIMPNDRDKLINDLNKLGLLIKGKEWTTKNFKINVERMFGITLVKYQKRVNGKKLSGLKNDTYYIEDMIKKFDNYKDFIQREKAISIEEESITNINYIIQKHIIKKHQTNHSFRKTKEGKEGYIYIISNHRVFGKEHFKVGMTRNTIPEKRIKALCNAALPFNWTIHAIIRVDEAYKIEKILHSELINYRVNKESPKKEHFAISLENIVEVVEGVISEDINWNYDFKNYFSPIDYI